MRLAPFGSVRQWGRTKETAAAVGVVLVASLLVVPALPARAEPVLPPGATRSAPKQSVGTAANRPHTASSGDTAALPAGPPVAPAAAPPPVPGAVGPRPVFPDPAVPGKDGLAQPVTLQAGPTAPGRTSTGVIVGQSREVPSERTARSTVFTNPDGTKTRRLYQEDAFVPGQRGSFIKADPTLARTADGRWAPVAAAPVSLAPTATDPALATVELGGGAAAGFRIDAAASVSAQVGREGARYADIRPGADLVLTPTVDGLKELIVLDSPAAPTSWTFPLNLRGVTPVMDPASGDVLLVDVGTEEVRARIPAGFMYDSAVDPRSGDPAVSQAVSYTLLTTDAGWALRVDLDGAWLRHPARRYPVTVDPAIRRNTESDDTFASSRDWPNGGPNDSVLRVGTYDGVEKAASYLHFNSAMSTLTNKYILGASLNLYNTWSYSCRPYWMTVYRVTTPWSASTVKKFPGPAYDASNPVTSANFAYGYDSCSADRWVTLGIPAERMTRWVHDAESFHGFTLRSDTNSVDSWKKFASANYGDAAAIPFLDVNYVDEGAGYALPNPSFVPPVTSVNAGKLVVRVTNWGQSTWTPTNGYRLSHSVVNGSGTVVGTGTYTLPANVAPGQSADVQVQVGALPLGSYTLRWDMLNPAGTAFQAAYGSPSGAAGFTVSNAAPTIVGNWPLNNAVIDTIAPTLWANFFDPDNYPIGTRKFSFRVCATPPPTETGCRSSGWTTNSSWRTEPGWLSWGSVASWYVTVSDGTTSSSEIGPMYFTPEVPQPPITGRLVGTSDDSLVPNVNPGVGNFSRTFTDANVGGPGPALAVTRTYNSQDPRESGAFGAGWSSLFDLRLAEDAEQRTLLFTAADGRQLRFGQRNDGTYSAPPGANLTLVDSNSGSWTYTLTDPSGKRLIFGANGVLQAIVDADGRTQEFDYDIVSGAPGNRRVREVRDLSTGRRLHVNWTGSRVTSVSSDPPAAGQPMPTWTYEYVGSRLERVCGPLSAQSCVQYEYEESSHYRSLVQDDNPRAYWPLGETSGGTAANVVARTPGENDGAYGTVTRGVEGPLESSTDPGVTFTGTTASAVTLPDNLINSSTTFSTELWFKATAGQQGVLLSEHNEMPGNGGDRYTPLLYIGQDGKLRGSVPLAAPSGPIIGLAGKCLDVVGATSADATPIQLYECNGTAAQNWTMKADGTLRAYDKCLDIQNGSNANGARLQLYTCNAGNNQQWRRNGNTLVNPWSGRCVDVPNANSANGTRIQIYDCHGDLHQRWNLTGGKDIITSSGRVDTGSWQHVVLTGNADRYELILNGWSVDVVDGVAIDHLDRTRATVGTGHATGFDQAPTGAFPFTGSVDEVAFYRYAMTEQKAEAHYEASWYTYRLTTVVEPGDFTSDRLTYDGATGRVATAVDRNGATWTVGQPVVSQDLRLVTVGSTVDDAVTFAYDPRIGGRLVSRTSSSGVRRIEYNASNFVSKVTDENGNGLTFTTDARGNVLSQTRCRSAGVCSTEYFGYYLNSNDPLDRRNDLMVWRSDGRALNANDITYRTTNVLDPTGRVTEVWHPIPAGQSTAPTERFSYTAGAGYTVSSPTRPFIPATGPALSFADLDSGKVMVDLPFPVTYYGQQRTAARISVDGYVSLTATGDKEEPTLIPLGDPLTGLDPFTVAFPYWDDMDLSEGGSVHTGVVGTAPNRQFVVEWRGVERYASGIFLTFEAVFTETGEFWFTYGTSSRAGAYGWAAVIGAVNAGGRNTIEYSRNQNSVQSGKTLLFTPTATPGGTPVAGLPLTTTAANGGVTQFGYNRSGDRVSTLDPAGLTTTVEYDGLGRSTASTRSATVGGSPVTYGTTRTTYNAASLPVTVTDPGIVNPVSGVTHTAVSTTEYDAAGRRTKETVGDSTGGDPSRVTSWAYDPAGRLTKTTAPDGAVTRQTWDTAGDLTTVTQPDGLVLEYLYDDHQPVQLTATGAGVDAMDPAATSLVLQSWAYDPAGRLAGEVDAMGRETVHTYYGDDLPATSTRVRRDADGAITSSTPLAAYEYDKAGNQTRQTVSGVTTSATYDPGGYLLTQVLDPGGIARTETYRTNLDGTTARVSLTGTEAPGRTDRIDYTYDAAGRLRTEAVFDSPSAYTTTYDRDPRGLVTRVTDPTGIVTDVTYDNADDEVTSTGAARTIWTAGVRTDGYRPVTTSGRNTFGDLTHHSPPGGPVTTTTYDAAGRAVSVSLPVYTPPGGSPITATTSTEYDSQGRPTKVTDPLNRVTTYGYDKHGRLTTETLPDPDGAGPRTAPVWTGAYDRLGNVRDVTDPTGAHTSATRNDLDQQVTSTRSERVGGQTVYFTTTTAYDAAGNPASVTTPRGKTTTTQYNKAGQLTRTTDPTGRFAAHRYDPAGRVVGSASGQGTTYASPVTTIEYDGGGRPRYQWVCTASSNNGTCSSGIKALGWTHDAAGRVTKETSFAGRVTTYAYDGGGHRSQVSQQVASTPTAVWNTVELKYDAAGRPSRSVDGNGRATDYTYNTWGLPESVVEPATAAHSAAADRTWTTGYNAAGEPVRQVLPGGVTRVRAFDGLGQLTGETGSGAEAATGERRINYDTAGRLATTSGPGGDTTYTWNDRGLLTAMTGPDGAASYTYDGDANIVSRTDASGAGTFTYDDAGRIATVTDPLIGRTETYTYDELGRTKSIGLGAGAPARVYTYDDHGRLAADVWKRPDGATTASIGYTYDDDDLLTGKTTTGYQGAGTESYGYDGAGRLTGWTKGASTVTYAYDAASNRTAVTGPTGTRTTTFDERNRALSSTGGGLPAETRTWSARGTLATTTGTATTTYAFDAFERMTRVTGPGSTVEYGYDAFDRLTRRGGAALRYGDLSNDPVAVPTASGESTVFRDAAGNPLSQKTGTAAGQTLLVDRGHADVLAAADPATGALTAGAAYDPHGTRTASTGTLPLGFQSGYTDPATGQVNAHARWYEPSTGAFASRDTWSLPADPVAQINRYQYGNADPANNTDRNGHYCDPERIRKKCPQPLKPPGGGPGGKGGKGKGGGKGGGWGTLIELLWGFAYGDPLGYSSCERSSGGCNPLYYYRDRTTADEIRDLKRRQEQARREGRACCGTLRMRGGSGSGRGGSGRYGGGSGGPGAYYYRPPVAPRPALRPLNDRPVTVDPTNGAGIVNSGDAVEPTIGESGETGVPPAQGYLEGTCFHGGHVRSDGTTSSNIWDCGVQNPIPLGKGYRTIGWPLDDSGWKKYQLFICGQTWEESWKHGKRQIQLDCVWFGYIVEAKFTRGESDAQWAASPLNPAHKHYKGDAYYLDQARRQLGLNRSLGGRGVRFAVSSEHGRKHFQQMFEREFPDAMATGDLQVWHVPGDGMSDKVAPW